MNYRAQGITADVNSCWVKNFFDFMVTQMYVAFEIFWTENILTCFSGLWNRVICSVATGLSEKKYCLHEEEIHGLEADDFPW